MLLLLCIMLNSDPDRRGRTSVCRRVTHFLDQRINAKFAKSMSASACLPTRYIISTKLATAKGP